MKVLHDLSVLRFEYLTISYPLSCGAISILERNDFFFLISAFQALVILLHFFFSVLTLFLNMKWTIH